jgi:hypothetical protein
MGEHERALREFVRALIEWTRTSIDSDRFAEDEASDMRMHAVVLKGMTALILDQTAERDQAAVCLHRLMGAVLYLGSRVMTSDSAVTFLRAEQTAPGRSKAAKKREPNRERMAKEIAEAARVHPSGRGINFHVAKKMGVNEKTVRRHRKKMRTP